MSDGAGGTRLSLGDYSFGGASGNVAADQYMLSFAWFDPGASTHGSMSIQGCKIGAGQTALNSSNTQPIANPRGAPNTGAFEIGRRYEGSFPLTGRVDSVAVWTGRILTLDERNLILTRTLAGSEWVK